MGSCAGAMTSKRTYDEVVSEDSIEQQFKDIVEAGEKLSGLQVNEQLEFYGLYKQIMNGDNTTPKPSLVTYEKYKKWAAWMEQKGKSKNDAMTEYVAKYR